MVSLEDLLKMSLTEDQIADYITGRTIMVNNNECGLVMLKIRSTGYHYTDEQVMELFERYHNEELTDEQMSYHLYLLFTFALRIKENKNELLTKSQRQLIDYYNGLLSYEYADAPLSKEEIKEIEAIFKEPVAAC